jgi:hypothetical protein
MIQESLRCKKCSFVLPPASATESPLRFVRYLFRRHRGSRCPIILWRYRSTHFGPSRRCSKNYVASTVLVTHRPKHLHTTIDGDRPIGPGRATLAKIQQTRAGSGPQGMGSPSSRTASVTSMKWYGSTHVEKKLRSGSSLSLAPKYVLKITRNELTGLIPSWRASYCRPGK